MTRAIRIAKQEHPDNVRQGAQGDTVNDNDDIERRTSVSHSVLYDLRKTVERLKSADLPGASAKVEVALDEVEEMLRDWVAEASARTCFDVQHKPSPDPPPGPPSPPSPRCLLEIGHEGRHRGRTLSRYVTWG